MSESSLPDHLIFNGNGGSYPPHGLITASDHGPAVVVATWIMVCLMGLAVIARFGTRQELSIDSAALSVASILAVLQSVVVHLAANHGLGRHTKNLNAHNYAYYSKAIYTSQILKILIHYLAKLSLILVFLRLTPARGMRRVLWLFGLIITLWAGTAMVTHSVQCPLPTPWKLSAPGCYNQEALYLTTGIINILSDAFIVVLPVAILWNVQIKQRRKMAVYMIFSVRIVVCIATSLELASLHDYLHNMDKPWFIVDPTIWGQASINLSIITACVPLMKPLIDMLQFSLIDSTIPLSAGIRQSEAKARTTS